MEMINAEDKAITTGAPAPVLLLTIPPPDPLSCLQPLSTTNLFSISATLAFLERATNEIYMMQALGKMMLPRIIS